MSTSLRVGRIVTGTADGVIEDGVVTIEGSRIASVRPFTADGETESVLEHHPDATLLPGLIDAHAHLTLSGAEMAGEEGRPYPDMIADTNEMMAIVAASNLATHFASGVTTLRDNGGRDRVPFVVREAQERGYLGGSRLLIGGRPITHGCGHFSWCHEEADGVDGVRAAVRHLVADGADHIKIMASGGGSGGVPPEHASYTVEELRSAVDTAHGLGRLITAHCRSRRSLEFAIEAGIDCVEHVEFLVASPGAGHGRRVPASGAHDAEVAYDPALVERMLEQGIHASITLQQGGYDRLVELRALAQGPGLDDRGRRWKQELEERYEIKIETLARMLDDGMQPLLVISSDAGVRNTGFGKMHLGLELGVMAGMSPVEAILAATRTAATACGVGHLVGTLEAGKEADLVLVEGDATRDLSCLAHVLAVYRAGVVSTPATAADPIWQHH